MSYLARIQELEQENAYLKQELAKLKKLIFSSKSDRFKPAIDHEQLNLFNKEILVEEESRQDEAFQDIKYKRKVKKNHPGRHPLPDHLPVNEVVIEPDEDTSGMQRLGEQITETLEYRPASLIKRRTIRPKYVERKTERIFIADLPSRPLPKSIAESSLLAHILVSKYVDHLPLYRQAQIFKREFDWKVSKSTMNDWVKGSCNLLKPLYEALIKKLLDCDYIQADESPMKVLEYHEHRSKGPPQKVMKGYQWVYYAPQSGLSYFNYRKGRGKNGPKEILAQYSGYLQCDGYQVYDNIAKNRNDITLIGCLAHARRKFVESQDSFPDQSRYAIEIFSRIYREEKLACQLSKLEHQRVRQEKIFPLMKQLKDWIEENASTVLPKSNLGKAMNYYQAQWKKLSNIVLDARIKLDNNLIENKIRPLALGRKNYLFAGSHSGAERAAMMYSFFATCKQHGICPRKWLSETLDKIADHPVNRIQELLPVSEKVLV